MLDQLLAIFETEEWEHDGGFEFAGFLLEKRQSTLYFKVWPGEVPTWQDWKITCAGTKRYHLSGSEITDCQLTNDHPLLWEYQEDQSELHLHGKPDDAVHLAWALYERHQQIATPLIPFGRYLNSFFHTAGLPRLLECGYGMLASGPTRLLAEYEAVLSEHGVNSYFFTGWDSTVANERRHASPDAPIIALILGKAYIIGSDFHVIKVSEGVDAT